MVRQELVGTSNDINKCNDEALRSTKRQWTSVMAQAGVLLVSNIKGLLLYARGYAAATATALDLTMGARRSI